MLLLKFLLQLQLLHAGAADSVFFPTDVADYVVIVVVNVVVVAAVLLLLHCC
jgi:hypothetical protein